MGALASLPQMLKDNLMRKEQETAEWFEQAIGEVLDDLFGAAVRLAKNHSDAEDLVSETVEKALKNVHSLQDRDCFRAWIFRIMTNCFYSECRKRKTRSETSLQDCVAEEDEEEFWLFNKLHQPFLLWWGNPEQEFINGLLGEDLTKAVDELPESFRVVLVLSEIEGFSYQEISDILDVPIGTVRSRLSRARSMLQKALWQHAQDAGINRSQSKSTERDSL